MREGPLGITMDEKEKKAKNKRVPCFGSTLELRLTPQARFFVQQSLPTSLGWGPEIWNLQPQLHVRPTHPFLELPESMSCLPTLQADTPIERHAALSPLKVIWTQHVLLTFTGCLVLLTLSLTCPSSLAIATLPLQCSLAVCTACVELSFGALSAEQVQCINQTRTTKPKSQRIHRVYLLCLMGKVSHHSGVKSQGATLVFSCIQWAALVELWYASQWAYLQPQRSMMDWWPAAVTKWNGSVPCSNYAAETVPPVLLYHKPLPGRVQAKVGAVVTLA